MTGYRTSLKQARGFGAARAGTGHFWRQRVTAVSNIVVVIFLVYTVVALAGLPREAVKAYFSQPLAAIFGVLLAISVPIHMRIGMQVIIEDYIHQDALKVVLLVANTFFSILIGVACVLAVAKLYLGA